MRNQTPLAKNAIIGELVRLHEKSRNNNSPTGFIEGIDFLNELDVLLLYLNEIVHEHSHLKWQVQDFTPFACNYWFTLTIGQDIFHPDKTPGISFHWSTKSIQSGFRLVLCRILNIYGKELLNDKVNPMELPLMKRIIKQRGSDKKRSKSK